MHRRGFLLIVATVILTLSGCRTNRTSQHASPTDPASSTDVDTQPVDAKLPVSQKVSQKKDAPPALAPATGPATNAANSDPRPIIACFGDSLTAGHGTDAGQSYPDYLQADLDSRGYHYRVVNEGISGNTTKDGVDRLDHILSLHPAVVIVEFGGNDGLRGLPIADTRANLDKIVATLKSSRTKVALAGITLPPNYGPDYIHQFDTTYTLLASKYHVPLLPFLLKGVFGVPGMMQEDMTHATASGNKIVAQNILPLITPLLRK
jgi:acyl-CoA thioesterase-1